MEFFVRGLTPPSLKQKAHQRQIEHPGDTWQDLKDYVINRDLSYTVSSEYACAGSSNFDNQSEIQALKNQLTELTNLMKENKINATYDPNQPRNRRNHTRFCNYCKRSGHTIAYCFEKKRHDEQNRQPPSYRDKFTDNYTDALDQMNTIDKTLPNKILGAELGTLFQVITKTMIIIIVLIFTTTLLAHHRITRCNDIPIHITKIVLHKMQTRDRVLEVLNLKTALMKIIEIIVGKDTDLSITEYKILRILDKIPTTLEVQVGTEKLFTSHQSVHKFRT